MQWKQADLKYGKFVTAGKYDSKFELNIRFSLFSVLIDELEHFMAIRSPLCEATAVLFVWAKLELISSCFCRYDFEGRAGRVLEV